MENRVIDGIELEGLEVVLINPEESLIYNAGIANKDKSAIHIYTHGNATGFRNRTAGLSEKANFVNNKNAFVAILQKSDLYETQKNSEKMTVVLHSCNTAPFAQKMSKDLGITIIAPDKQDWFGFWGEQGPYESIEKCSPDGKRGSEKGAMGNWLVYTEGVLTSVYKGSWDPKADPGMIDNFLYKKDLTYSVNVSDNSYLNLRLGAGSSHGSVAQLQKGASLTPTGNVENGWMEVNTGDGQTGWVDSQYTTPQY